MSSLARDLWTAERARLLREVEEGTTVTVSAAEPAYAADLVHEVLGRTHVASAVVDFTRLGEPSSVATDLVEEVAGLIVGQRSLLGGQARERLPEETKRLLEARRLLGDAFDRIDGKASNSDSRAAVTAMEALATWAEGEGLRPYLVLIGSERSLLVPRLGELMWAIRGAAQRLRGLGLIFCGGPGAAELTTNPEAAFYGWGINLRLLVPTLDLEHAIAARFARARVPAGPAARFAKEIAERSQGSISTADLLCDGLLAQAGEQSPSIQRAWDQLVDRLASRNQALAAAVAGLHAIAVPIAIAIARGEPPYRSNRALSNKIARAINALRVAGVIDRERPGSWHIVDPVFAEWLRTDHGNRYRSETDEPSALEAFFASPSPGPREVLPGE